MYLSEWRLRRPASAFRATVYGALRLYVWLSSTLLLLPVMRMLLAPFICNVAIQNVTLQMVRNHVAFVSPIAPAEYFVIIPQPNAIAMVSPVPAPPPPPF